MTELADILDRAARQISVVSPFSWLTATDDEHLEVKDFLDETAKDLLDRYDLPSPISKAFTIPADGSETYLLPADYYRLQRDCHAVFETTTQRRPLTPVTNDGEWQHLKEIGSTGAERYYRLQGYEGNYTISIFDEPPANVGIIVNYVAENWIYDPTNLVFKSTHSNARDISLLPRKVIEKGIVYRWRERKGLDFEAALTEYEMLAARLSNDTRARRTITYGDVGQRSVFDVPVPDFIPAS